MDSSFNSGGALAVRNKCMHLFICTRCPQVLNSASLLAPEDLYGGFLRSEVE